MLNSLPQSQRQTGWVLNELARSYMDDQKFQLAKLQYKELLELEPYRVVGMEFYASCLYRKVTESSEKYSHQFLNR
jgi:cytochrome c-type biogenesis protein CcmH/NrfG